MLCRVISRTFSFVATLRAWAFPSYPKNYVPAAFSRKYLFTVQERE